MIAAKLSRWIIFGVALTLVPLALRYFILSLYTPHPNVKVILEDGELLLISSMMCAGAIGEFVGSAATYRVWKIIVGGSSACILLATAFFFAAVRPPHMRGTKHRSRDDCIVFDMDVRVFVRNRDSMHRTLGVMRWTLSSHLILFIFVAVPIRRNLVGVSYRGLFRNLQNERKCHFFGRCDTPAR